MCACVYIKLVVFLCFLDIYIYIYIYIFEKQTHTPQEKKR